MNFRDLWTHQLPPYPSPSKLCPGAFSFLLASHLSEFHLSTGTNLNESFLSRFRNARSASLSCRADLMYSLKLVDISTTWLKWSSVTVGTFSSFCLASNDARATAVWNAVQSKSVYSNKIVTCSSSFTNHCVSHDHSTWALLASATSSQIPLPWASIESRVRFVYGWMLVSWSY